MALRLASVRSIRPAPTSSTNVAATCSTTSASRNRRADPPTFPRACCCSTSAVDACADCTAGPRLKSTPVTIESTPANDSSRQSSTEMFSPCRPAGTMRSMSVLVTTGIARPSTPPATDRHKCFDQHLPRQPCARRTERQTYRVLAAAHRGSRQQQARQVGAGDEHDGHRRDRQRDDFDPRVAEHLLAHRDDDGTDVAIRFRVLPPRMRFAMSRISASAA